MIKQKAPKDMTVEEFIDLVERRYGTKEPTNMSVWINTLRMIADEPAPNPFTPDQIAWMRVEQQDAYFYAAMDYDGEIHLFGEEPEEDGTHWNRTDNYSGQSLGLYSWLKDFLTPGGSFLCFADYAPLEGADK